MAWCALLQIRVLILLCCDNEPAAVCRVVCDLQGGVIDQASLLAEVHAEIKFRRVGPTCLDDTPAPMRHVGPSCAPPAAGVSGAPRCSPLRRCRGSSVTWLLRARVRCRCTLRCATAREEEGRPRRLCFELPDLCCTSITRRRTDSRRITRFAELDCLLAVMLCILD